MRKVAAILAVVGVVLALNSVEAEDYNPPPWTRGGPGTTYQKWEFGTDDATPSPEADYINPLGEAGLEVTGTAPWTVWLADDHEHGGVWKFEDYIQVDIFNFDQENPYKEIWVQLTFAADGMDGLNPILSTVPAATGAAEVIHKEQIDDWYWRATYSLIIELNPSSETIYIQPRDCTMYLDELVIDTICVPEPITICLLGLGGLLLARRRRV